RNKILLLGISGSGKTVLIHQIIHKTRVETVPSLMVSEKPLDKLVLVDVPGHEKLRFYYTKYLQDCKEIWFVLDGSVRDMRPAAEYLYDVLVNNHISRNATKITILVNRSQFEISRLQEQMETEINQLRQSRSGDVEQHEFLGYENEDFKFEHVPNPVVF
ncbi:signal recognition particle receptor, beta subunit, partial [Gorgonomyces haynaldii]